MDMGLVHATAFIFSHAGQLPSGLISSSDLNVALAMMIPLSLGLIMAVVGLFYARS